MESPKNNDKHLRESHSLSILPPRSKVVLTRTRGLSFESANMDQCHFSERMSRCVSERIKEEKSELRRRSSSVATKKERANKKKSKVVRFADTLGLECAITVREYNKEEEPEDHYSLSREHHSPDYAAILQDSLTFEDNFSAEDQWWQQRVLSHNLSLFKVHISEDLLCGLVLLRNLSPEKSLFVRWTHDLWASFTDSYSYFCSKFNDTVDQFSFQIILPPSVMTLGGSMEFALCFKCQSKEFWDNNNGENYRLLRTLRPSSK